MAELLAIKRDLARDSLAFAANDAGEIHASAVLHQDVERGRTRYRGKLQLRCRQPAVEGANEFLIQIHLRVIVKTFEAQLATGARLEASAVKHISIRLVHVFHGE